MAIQRPGERHRYHRLLKRKGRKRNVTAVLSLTAMVDMFTVLVIFLLQNYNTTGKVIFLPKEVNLPKAQYIKPLKPTVVITITSQNILIDKTPVVSAQSVKSQSELLIPDLKAAVEIALQKAKSEFDNQLQVQIQKLVKPDGVKEDGGDSVDKNQWRQVTVQADKNMDFLTVRKVLFTLIESGAGPVNFAVLKQAQE